MRSVWRQEFFFYLRRLFLSDLPVPGADPLAESILSGSLLLVGTGVITTVPLLLFGYAAQKIPLSTLGLMQYLAPSINLVLGVFVYGEEFPPTRMVGFLLIWSALAIFMAENLLRRFRNKKKVLAVVQPTENV